MGDLAQMGSSEFDLFDCLYIYGVNYKDVGVVQCILLDRENVKHTMAA
jgi:hypothetical protein